MKKSSTTNDVLFFALHQTAEERMLQPKQCENNKNDFLHHLPKQKKKNYCG